MSRTQDKPIKSNNGKRALAMREDKARRVQVAKFRRRSIVFFAIVLPVVLMLLMVLDYLYRPGSFALEELRFQGSFSRVQLNEVEQRTHLALHGNFFTVDLANIRDELQTVPWVKDVSVRRQWPNSLSLQIIEHVPQMRWGKTGWVSRSGHVILDKTAEGDMSAPILNGDVQHVAELFAFAQLWQAQLRQRGLMLRQVDRSSSRAWTVHFSKPQSHFTDQASVDSVTTVKVLLGSQDVQNRLDRFLKMYAQNVDLLRNSHLVDARYPNGLAVVPVISNSNEDDATAHLSSL